MRSGGRAAKSPHCLSGIGGFDFHPLRHEFRGVAKASFNALGSDPRDRKFKSFLPCQILCESEDTTMANKRLFASLRGELIPQTDTVNAENAPAYALAYVLRDCR